MGVGEKLEEDGVYGERTKKAVDTVIADVSKFLADTDKVQRLARVVDLMTIALDFATGSRSQLWEMRSVLQKSCRELERTVWKLGAEYYLRPRGYYVAALLLEHAIEKSPGNLHFSQSHWVVQKLMQSNGFQKFYRNLENQIQQHPSEHTLTGSEVIKFGNIDTDLYLGFGDCTVYYTCIRNPSSIQIDFTVYDEYNFDAIRSVSGDVERVIKLHLEIGNLANDAALFSQADGAISKYKIYAKFQKTILLKEANL